MHSFEPWWTMMNHDEPCFLKAMRFSWYFRASFEDSPLFYRLQGLKEQHVHRDQGHGDGTGLEKGSQQVGPQEVREQEAQRKRNDASGGEVCHGDDRHLAPRIGHLLATVHMLQIPLYNNMLIGACYIRSYIGVYIYIYIYIYIFISLSLSLCVYVCINK